MRFFLFFICTSPFLFAQKPDTLTLTFLQSQFSNSLHYLIDNQEKNTIPGRQYRGEWPVDMELTEPYFFMGKRQKARDSNCFTVSAVHNFLAEIYLADTTQKILLPTLSKAFEEINSYRNGLLFNFWKALPPTRKLKLFAEPNPQPLVRRPTHFKLKSRLLNNMANIPEDADDTPLGNLAAFYQNRIFKTHQPLISAKGFDKHIDNNRSNKNFYNVVFHRNPNSGAFLTWQAEEHSYNAYYHLKSFLHTLFLFVPGSSAKPKPYIPWIPFGANDVDAVVNANVLSYLATTGQLAQSASATQACEMINKRMKLKFWPNSTLYYPNQFHLHYAISRAHSFGVADLETACQKIIADLDLKQNPDGSFASQSYINQHDYVQSTAYALHTMLDLKDAGYKIDNKKIEHAIIFLLSKAQKDNTKVFWKGGVYFSGGTLLRNILFWKSDAYTTALIAKCLQKYMHQTWQK
jgi:hypothetical protein